MLPRHSCSACFPVESRKRDWPLLDGAVERNLGEVLGNDVGKHSTRVHVVDSDPALLISPLAKAYVSGSGSAALDKLSKEDEKRCGSILWPPPQYFLTTCLLPS